MFCDADDSGVVVFGGGEGHVKGARFGGDESKVRTTLRRYSRIFKCSDSRVNTDELWYSSPSTL